MSVPAISQRVGLSLADRYGHMHKDLVRVPMQERVPEEQHSANARDTQEIGRAGSEGADLSFYSAPYY